MFVRLRPEFYEAGGLGELTHGEQLVLIGLACETGLSPAPDAPRFGHQVAPGATRLGRKLGLRRRSVHAILDRLCAKPLRACGGAPAVRLVCRGLGREHPSVYALHETVIDPLGEVGDSTHVRAAHPPGNSDPGNSVSRNTVPASTISAGNGDPGSTIPSSNTASVLLDNREEEEREAPSSPLVDNLGKAELAAAWKRSRGLELRQGPACARLAGQHGVTAAQLDLVLAYTLTRPPIAGKALTYYLSGARWEGLLAEAEAWRGAKARGTADDWRRDPARLRAAIENAGRRIEHFHPSDPQHAELVAQRAELERLLAACEGTEAVA